MSSCRIRRRIGRRPHISSLPPGEDQPGDNHDQHDLQQQTDDRGEARHATEKSVPEQQTKQTCAEEAGSNPAEQSAAEQAGRIAVWPWARRMLAIPALTLAGSWLYRSEPGITFKGFAEDLL
jgi:hypothetical protein